MSAVSLTRPRPAEDYDPLLDKSYRDSQLGPEVAAWLAWLEMGGYAARTLDQYERDLARLCGMYPTRPLADVTDAELGQVVRSWPKGSRRVRKAALDSFFKWAVRTRRIDKNPMNYLPVVKRPGQKWQDIFSDAEIGDLLALAAEDALLMMLLFDAGLRKSEARGLQMRRLKLVPGPGEVIVLAGKGGKDRVIPMTSRLNRELQTFLALEQLGPQDHLWYDRPGGTRRLRRSQMIGERSFARWWSRCLDEAGVRYRNPHVARHTFATRWLRRGGRLETLSVAMGHASIRTTFDLYGHLDTRDVAADLVLIEAFGEERSESRS